MINEENYNKIISKNLKRLAYEHEKSQADIARDLGISKATLSSWMTGTRTPKIENIDMLCKYFGVDRSAIMEPAHDMLGCLLCLVPFQITFQFQ